MAAFSSRITFHLNSRSPRCYSSQSCSITSPSELWRRCACPQPQFAITCSLELLRCCGLSTASSALWSFGIPLKFNHPIALLFLWLPFRTHKQYDVSLQHPSSSSLAFPYHYFNLLSACLSCGPCPSSYFKIIYSRPSLSHSSQATSPALLESWPPSPKSCYHC